MSHRVPQSDLTESQQQAVEHFEGPLLVLAGPGSGKTRVITRRIVRLIERGVDPREILAITFTNKAAREMAERVALLLPGSRVWVTTFHRFGARLLRQHAEAVGLRRNFTIYDSTDQKQLIRQIIGDLDHDAVKNSPGQVASRISLIKNRLILPEEFAQSVENSYQNISDRVVAQVYSEYRRALLASNAVDFDDLLLHVVMLLHENPDLRHRYDERFRFILVDEYQDTNLAQYSIVSALSQDHQNLCATGDPDQSIYGWRGADVSNILRFEQDYPQTTTVRLEQNFRSTKSILRSADSLIAHNLRRKQKSLITDNPEGRPVELLQAESAADEAEGIASFIREQVGEGNRRWGDFAILYRVNALSRRLEIACMRQGIPFQVAAGVAYYERAEVKDLLAYLRLVLNPSDQTSFRRVVNTPIRGIGKQTQAKLLRFAEVEKLTPLEAAAQADRIPKLSKRAVFALKRFSDLMNEFSLSDSGSVEGLLTRIIERTGYARQWEDSRMEEDVQRRSNVNELVAAARQYDETQDDEPSLEGFLETTSLVSDVDAVDPEAGRVTLMTMHAAKGLEFPVVFILGVEQNLIPHERSLKNNDPWELEEERRLLFVAMTRAREELYLTATRLRDIRGTLMPTIPSIFLNEMELVRSGLGREVEDDPRGRFEAAMAARRSAAPQGDTPPAKPEKPLLTTAASLLEGSAPPTDSGLTFTVGMLVRHPQKGLGTVVAANPVGTLRTVTVEFENGDRASFVTRKCPLQPVGVR